MNREMQNSPPVDLGVLKIGYSIREACEASSLGRTALYGHIAAGRLRVTRVGGRTIVPADALRAFILGSAAS